MKGRWNSWRSFMLAAASLVAPATPVGAEIEVPHGQTEPPGPPKSPAEAREAMTVPDGFEVRLVAAEPDIVNPVAMTWDDRGRIWVCESIQYPHRDPVPGRDRIRIHEDTNNDGVTDTVKTFAEGLRIPCGIAYGHGGVFVANAPDLLFMKDTTGDDRADHVEVLLTGFGTHDTHELPNTLTWGPDGWLYGLNGVFNPSRIEHDGEVFAFTCALWRYHPIRRTFELYAEGTSNPWGLDYNHNGSWFVSACVIDHLWHLTQTGYYRRQAGAYPSNTWIIESIVDHRHQRAAYCGLAFYDAEVYPESFRGDLFMGNIHGNCINRDELERRGSTYFAKKKEDFLSANDTWFMPVSIQLGPDGCFWILDWYDRYHCYQDAMRDPDGVDRTRGRLWRVVYDDAPMPDRFDLGTFTNAELIDTLSHSNAWWRRRAHRLLVERNAEETVAPLKRLAMADSDAIASRMALWALIAMERVDPAWHHYLLRHPEPTYRAWGVRVAAEAGTASTETWRMIRKLADDGSPDVRLQVAIASSRLDHPEAWSLALDVADHPDDDPLIPQITWQNLHPRVADHGEAAVTRLTDLPLDERPVARAVTTRLAEMLLPRGDDDGRLFAALLSRSLEQPSHRAVAHHALDALLRGALSGQVPEHGARLVDDELRARLRAWADGDGDAGGAEVAVLLLALWKEVQAVEQMRARAADPSRPVRERVRAIETVILVDELDVWGPVIGGVLRDAEAPLELKRRTLAALGRRQDAAVAGLIVDVFGTLPGELQPVAVDLLTGRGEWAHRLMTAVADERIARTALNTNHVRTMREHGDVTLNERIERHWGVLRERRDEEREAVIERLRGVLTRGEGDAARGQVLFKQFCAQCHKIYGYGIDLGPDITDNGRANLDQILSNVFDPNLVIGEGYVARTVWTYDGEIITGIPIEDAPERLVLKIAGGGTRSIPRDDIEDMRVSRLSLMPEELEEAMDDQEIRDLVSFLLTTEPPVPWSEVPDVTPRDY